MKTIFLSAFAAAALSLTPGSLYAVDQFSLQGVKNDRQLQELNGPAGFGPLERSSQGTLFGRGFNVQPLDELSLPEGSERMLENAGRLSLESGITPDTRSLPSGGTLKEESKINEPPPEQADITAEFQD